MELAAQCCIAGGGPAGMMAGFLLARAGVDVVVLEKHGDFLRDFRGDTIHPSTLELLAELGLDDAFLALPHQEVRVLRAQIGETLLPVADFGALPVRHPFIAMVPQWDFLDFLARQARRYPSFRLLMPAQVESLVENEQRVCGVRASTPSGELVVRAGLVLGADGRHSIVRERAELPLADLGAPIDVLWFRLSRASADPPETMARFDRGRIVVMLNRGDYWQCAFVIAKGGLDALQRRGLPAFRARVAAALPFAASRMEELASWNDVKLLTVQVNRLKRWYREGLLCIGDAAHAMSPVGGVGINLAVQDAVAAANLLWRDLRAGPPPLAALRAVQARRELPTRMTQAMQVLVQKLILRRLLDSEEPAPLAPPLPVRLLARHAGLRRIPARLVGLGVRPEHVASPDALAVAA